MKANRLIQLSLLMKIHPLWVTWMLGAAGLCAAADWPQWRGPVRSGHSAEAGLPVTWGGADKENVLWKVPSDFGHSSPIVWGERLFLSASVRKLPKVSDQTADNQQHRVACFRTTDGAKLWQTDIDPGSWDTMFSFTTPTPITDGKRLFAFFGSATLAALDLDGKLI